MESFLGCILPWPINFAPEGWLYCNGQSMSIAQNQALYSLLGTQYGQVDSTHFNLPNLNNRMTKHFDSNTSQLGTVGGAAQVVLTANNLPSHTHAATVSSTTLPNTLNVARSVAGDQSLPTAGMSLASAPAGFNMYGTAAANTAVAGVTVTNSGVTVSPSGGSMAVGLLPPYLALNWIICVSGLYPSRP